MPLKESICRPPGTVGQPSENEQKLVREARYHRKTSSGTGGARGDGPTVEQQLRNPDTGQRRSRKASCLRRREQVSSSTRQGTMSGPLAEMGRGS